MDDLDDAIKRTLEAADGQPAVLEHVRRAAQLARFETREDGGPFRDAPLSPSVPQPPPQPLLPALQGRTELAQALEHLQYQLVWAADCAEFTDATNNARQYLQAAGHVDLAARALLGPDGLAQWPAVLVRDLAAATGLDLKTLVPAMGMFPPHTHVYATFAWDMFHENPITDPDDLGRRELISYRVGDIAWEKPKPAAKPLGDLDNVKTPEDLQALAPVNAIELATALGAPDAFARTVDVHMSSWQISSLTFRGWTVIATLRDAPTGGNLDLRLPAARAAALGPDDVVSDLRVG